jgi:7-cyano-7-deazaguanine reductase
MSKLKLKALAHSAQNKRLYRYSKPHPNMLETFISPVLFAGGKFRPTGVVIDIDVPEFTSLCPLTGQPDYATLQIQYRPLKLCIESKSLKLYLMAYRQHGAFHEQCLTDICNAIVSVAAPAYVKVSGRFGARGGISFNPTVEWSA